MAGVGHGMGQAHRNHCGRATGHPVFGRRDRRRMVGSAQEVRRAIGVSMVIDGPDREVRADPVPRIRSRAADQMALRGSNRSSRHRRRKTRRRFRAYPITVAWAPGP